MLDNETKLRLLAIFEERPDLLAKFVDAVATAAAGAVSIDSRDDWARPPWVGLLEARSLEGELLARAAVHGVSAVL